MKKKADILRWAAVLMLTLGVLTILWLAFFREQSSRQVPADGATGPIRNVLLITLDTTRADKLGIYGCAEVKTPALDRLASEGVYFKNTYTPAPLTLPAHSSILTGTYPPHHKVRLNGSYFLPEQIDTLVEILEKKGFDTAAFVSSFILDGRFGLKQGFKVYNDNLDLDRETKVYNSQRSARHVYEDFAAWFATHHQKQFFSWVHFYDPHLPYTPPEPYLSDYRDDLYLGEIAYMDEYVGKIIRLLEDKGLLENTLVIVVGDHGEAFGEHKEYGHMIFCYEENLRVPFIAFSRQKITTPRAVEQQVNLVDIMPTILELLDLPIPAPVQGKSLKGLLNGQKMDERDFYFESEYAMKEMGCAPVRGVIRQGHKFIDLPRAELYNISQDPQERKNLVTQNLALSDTLRKRTRELHESLNTLSFQAQRDVSPAELKKLESLGYLSGVSAVGDEAKRSDPKDRIDSYNQHLNGLKALESGDNEAAERYLLSAVAMNPQSRASYMLLADLYIRKNETKKAMDLYRQRTEADPQDLALKLAYAQSLIDAGRLADAYVLLQEIERQNPIDIIARVKLLLADICLAQNQILSACDYYEKALDMEADNLNLKNKLANALLLSKQSDKALALYLEIAKESPQDMEVLHRLAILHSQLEHFDEADACFKSLLKNAPPAAVYFNYALMLGKKGDYQNAIATMNRFLSLCPTNDERQAVGREWIGEWQSK